jgi:hypothetical protein
MKNQPIKNLKKINGLVPWSIGMAADMLWVQFGKQIEHHSRVTGKTKIIGEIGLHLQCSWRFSLHNKLFLGSSDVYRLDKDVLAKKLSDLNNLISVPKKSKVLVRKSGEFLVYLGNGIVLHVLPVCSDGEENWRILDNVLKAHHIF